MKILIVEGDEYTAEALKIALLEASYAVEIATESLSSWELSEFLTYDLILLDADLPKFDNLTLAKKLKEKGCHAPILLMLDSHNQQDLKISLDAGISNCIIKPFDVQDLIVQIDYLLNKNYLLDRTLLTWGSLQLNFNSQQITYYDKSVELDVKEMSILELFFRHQTRVFSSAAILDIIFYLDSTINKHAVRKLMKQLAYKLNKLGMSDLIETVYGNGYRLKSACIESLDLDCKYPPLQPKLIPYLWIISQDSQFIYQLLAEAVNWGINTQVIDTVSAIAEIPNESSNIILLDMSVYSTTEGLQDILKQIYIGKTCISLVALLSEEDIKDRLTISDFYPRAVCSKSSSPTEILDIVTQSAMQFHIYECRVLFMDSDRDFLLKVRRLLEPWGFIIVTLEDKSRFWETMRLFNPELLILGQLEPKNDAFSISESLREHSQWANLSIIFLISNSDNLAIDKVFNAGGDDFVCQPIIEAELVHRVLSCWEKVKINRTYTQIDALTEVSNHHESTKDIQKLLHLARRQNQILSLVVVHINNFAEIQKLFGYISVNDVLQFLSSFLQESLRTEDVVVCWGEEFLVSMYGINKVDAVERLNKILVNIHVQQFTASNGTKFRIDCTMAVAQYPQDGTDINLLYQFTKKNLS